MKKRAAVVFLAFSLSGCAGLGAVAAVMQGLGDGMAQNQYQDLAVACNQGNAVACINYNNAQANYYAAQRQQQYLQQQQTQRMIWGN